MSSRLRTLLEDIGHPDRFPEKLAVQYPRIAEKIADMWGSDALEAYFEELLIMDRNDRQGFPPEIGAELMLLSLAYDQSRRNAQDEDEDVWSNELIKARDELEQLGFEPTVRDFHHSISTGQHHAIDLYLRAGMTLESADEQGWTPLMRVAFEGNTEMLQALLRRGARADAHDRDGYGPLHWAALAGHDEAVRMLIEYSGGVNNTSRNGFTPLIQAASGGHTAVVQRLINAGAHVNQTTLDGWTAMHKAVSNGHLDAAIKLLDLGADPLARYVDGTTPLQMAIDGNMRKLCDVIQLTLSLRQRLDSAAVDKPL
ncbi:Actin-binding protein [Andreprevotia sp. IGB-42]|uniref:ankyrin repeat domain-containing protein n=1 Tax=Andreprevotia sp. IGB-42 TaxID=2497473 RepID=UPI001356EBDF|nr:ankyrin repeat domain-containing protein [Andreprevotia sp. IGB-42]KAF0813141.1 Actin-binding protein [Andreprevotia sp. IGB-42]